jgi:O-antigen/teichoic acid export membrane protein
MAEHGSGESAAGHESATTPNGLLPIRLLRRISGGKELWALSDQGLVSGANFLTNITLARELGIDGFGVFALCWMIVLLMSNLQAALIISPMMSVGPKQEPNHRALYFGAVTAQALCLDAALSLCVYIGALGFAHYFPTWHVGPLAIPLTFATGAYVLQDYTRRYFFTIGRTRLAMACDALSYLTQLPLLWLLAAHKQLTTQRALWMIGLTSMFSVIVSFFWREELQFSRQMIRSVAHRHWKMARWLAPSSILQWVSLNVFMVSAPVYYGAEAVGALRACQNVVAIAHVWFLGLDNVIPPAAARQLHEGGVDALRRYIWKMLLKWGFLTLGFVALIGVAPSFWLRLIYGASYSQYGYVLRLYGVLYLMIFVGGPLRAGLQAIETTAPLLWSYIAMTVFAAIIAAPMAKKLGLVGVMLGLIATQFVFQAIIAAALVVYTSRIRNQERIALEGGA